MQRDMPTMRDKGPYAVTVLFFLFFLFFIAIDWTRATEDVGYKLFHLLPKDTHTKKTSF
jgi:hypothetical protein